MRILKRTFSVLLLFLFPAFFPALAHGAEIHLSVAASMTDALKEISAAYRLENPGVSIITNSGSSGALAKQISQGAPADLVISANTRWMEYLVEKGKVDGQTVRIVATNTLVFLGSAKAGVSSLDALPSLSRIAIGSPQSVPAGQYAEQAMRAAKVYTDLLNRNRLVMAKDVRQALAYADRGEVDGAFVYRTDALLAKNAVILFTIPSGLHDRIDYPVGLTPAGVKNKNAGSFYTFLTGPAAIDIFKKFGFSAPLLSGAGTF